jgi:DNA-binding NtrC family response regulator
VPASERTLEASEVVVRTDQPLAAVIQHVEQTMIQRVMAKAGSVDEAARMLGLSRKGLYLKRLRFGIQIERPRAEIEVA